MFNKIMLQKNLNIKRIALRARSPEVDLAILVGMGATKDAARAQKTRAAAVFGLVGEVVGVGITRLNDGYGLKVSLREEPAPDVQVPQDVNGVPVRVVVTGPIRKR